MAASITAKTVTATGTVLGGRTRLKAFYVKTASSGSPAVVFKNVVAVQLIVYGVSHLRRQSDHHTLTTV